MITCKRNSKPYATCNTCDGEGRPSNSDKKRLFDLRIILASGNQSYRLTFCPDCLQEMYQVINPHRSGS